MIDFEFRQIGVVRSSRKEACLYPENEDLKIDKQLALEQYTDMTVSEIVVHDDYADCLDGIEEFSHLYVLFLTQFKDEQVRGIKKVHPGGFVEFPIKGIFATRSPVRPNPLGLTLIKLLERKENVLVCKGLDAIEGTMVLDIKPYITYLDTPENPRDPAWVIRLFDYIDQEERRFKAERGEQ